MAVNSGSAAPRPLRKLSLSYLKEAIAGRAWGRGRGMSDGRVEEEGPANKPQRSKTLPDLLHFRAKPPGLLKSIGRRLRCRKSHCNAFRELPRSKESTSSDSSYSLSASDESPADGFAPATRPAWCPPLPEVPKQPVTVRPVYSDPIPEPTHSLTRELSALSRHGWYWGPISRDEAEEKLCGLPDGSFLVRDSSADRYLLSLSFRSHGHTLHTRIEHAHGLFSFYAHPNQEGFPTIGELVQHSLDFSRAGVFCYSRASSPGSPSFPVRLTRPVSRFTKVRSLQYLCRFVIRQYTRLDNIQKLPLPSRLQGYIQEARY